MIPYRIFIFFLCLLLTVAVDSKRKDEHARSEDGGENDDGSGSRSGSRSRGQGQGRGHGHGHDLNEEHPGRGHSGRGGGDTVGIKKILREGHENIDEIQQVGTNLIGGVIKNLTDGVRRIDPKGTLKHIGKKLDKKPKLKNQKSYIWKGKKITRAGPDGNIPPLQMKIANFSRLPFFGKSCKTAQAPTVAPPTEINQGPNAEGFQPEHFKPCQDRKRGSKRLKIGRDDKKNKGHHQQHEQQQQQHEHGHERQKRSETYSSISWLWSDPEHIPIMFDKSYPESSRAGGRAAWQYWANHTCLRFVEQPTGTNLTEPHILLMISGSGACATDRLGPAKFPPYATKIDVTQCVNLTGSITHELGHALGLSHSQKRVDRDQSINVNLNNIAPAWQSQFERDNDKQFDEWGVPYYYDSIMQYFPYAATSNGLMTICPLDPMMEAVMGQREEPAFGDISIINRIYCQESCFNKSELKTLNFTGSLSMTISGRNCQNWSKQTPHKHRYASIGDHDYCRNADRWSGGPWCYTMDPLVPYEPCFAACEDLAAAGRPFCHGWCYNGGFHNPDTCECICPRYASGEYCQNIDMTIKHAHVPCGGQLKLKKGYPMGLSSPNWPHNYTENALCLWWIQAPENMKVRANVSDFLMEIPDETGCYDYLEIRKSICAAAKETPDTMRYCGNSLAPDFNKTVVRSILSDDQNLVLKFVTDDHENARGFSIILEAINKTNTTNN